jgi:hypothetical protein
MAHENTREFSRVPGRFAVTVRAEEDEIVPDHTTDVSMNGLFAVAGRSFPVGTECEVVVHLGEAETREQIVVRGRVARVADHGFAVTFEEIGIDSYDHLQKLVRYNAPDLSRVEREFDQHLGLKRAE